MRATMIHLSILLAATLASTAQAQSSSWPQGTAIAVQDGPFCNPCSQVRAGALQGGFGIYLQGASLPNNGQTLNASAAYVRLLPAPSVVPFAPGSSVLEMGVYASRGLQHIFLTLDGKPGPPRDPALATYGASASATFSDTLTFLDAGQPLGAPMTVTLGYYLSTKVCGAGAPPGSSCVLLPPPGFNDGDDPHAQAYSATELRSSVELPGGTDTVNNVHVESIASAYPPGAVPGPGNYSTVGNSLSHTFTVANGASVPFQLSALATVSFPADYYGSLAASHGYYTGWRRLDYLNTLRIGEISGIDAAGSALTGLQMINGYGWTMLAEPLPVPEPSTALLWAAALGLLALRRRSSAHER